MNIRINNWDVTDLGKCHGCITVWRGTRGVSWGKRIPNESAFFYALRTLVKSFGHDVIKKCPAKDGALTSMPYYLRERKGDWAIVDNYYAIRNAAKDYNAGLTVRLDIVSV